MWTLLLSIADVENAQQQILERDESPKDVETTAIASVDVYKAHIYVGTSEGLLASFALQDSSPTLIKATTTKKTRSVASMFALPTPERLLVFTKSGAAAGYITPSLELAQGVAMRDVHGGCALEEPTMAAVLSSSAIRVIKVTAETGIKLVRTIDCQGALTMCRVSGSLIGVGSSEGSFFVDTSSKASVIPLVPSGPGMVPFVLPAGPDSVLVVQGMSLEEMATGLVLNSSGEIQEGDVIVWDGYPTALATSASGYAVAITQGKLQINNLKTAKPLDPGVGPELGTVSTILRLSERVNTRTEELASKLGDKNGNTWADIAIVGSTGVHVWYAPPKFLQTEQEIIDGTLKEIVVDPLTASTEQGVVETEYLSLLIAMQALEPGPAFKVKTALHHWIDGPRLDYHIVLYIFDLEKPVPKVYPGLEKRLQDLHAKSAQLSPSFLKAFLKAEYKRRRDAADQQVILKHFVPLLDDDELGRLGLSTNARQRAVVIKEAEAQHRYAVLEHIYTVQGNDAELVQVWLRSVRGDWKRNSQEIHHAAKHLSKHLKRSTNAELVWTATLELLKVDAELALNVFMDRKAELDDSDILDALKDMTHGGDPWRKYLRHVVVTAGDHSANKDYLADFTMLIVSDLLEAVDAKVVDEWYETFSSQPWPRPDFWAWSVPRQSEDYRLKLLDFWGSLLREELELTTLLPVFSDGPLASLRLERAAIFSRLGLHEQAVDLLATFKDFRSLHWYTNYGEPLNPYSLDQQAGSATPPPPSRQLAETDPVRLDLHQLVFKKVATTTEDAGVIRELLGGSPLELGFVLAHIAPSTSSTAIRDFAATKLKERAYELQIAHLKYALEKKRSIV